MSLRSQVNAELKKQGNARPEWDASVRSEAGKDRTVEDRMATKIASEILKDNTKLKNIHSATSMKKILEKEAKKQLLTGGGGYKGPII